MNTRHKTLFKQAMTNPSEVFDSPLELSNDNRFSLDQKLKILESWAVDAKALMRAEAENMEADDTEKKSAAGLLELINKAELQIKASK